MQEQVKEVKKKAILEINIKTLLFNECLSTFKAINEDFYSPVFIQNLQNLVGRKRKPYINFFYPNVFSKETLPLEFSENLALPGQKKNMHMKNDLLKVLINQIKLQTKSNEIKWAIDHFEKTTKRELKNKIKNQEVDHFLMDKINLCTLLGTLSSNSFSLDKKTPNDIKLSREEDLILHYTSENLNGTFLEFNLDTA